MVEVKFGLRSVDVPYTIRLYGITDEMFDEMVDEDTKAELIDGVMIVHSPASLRCDDIGGFLRCLMRGYADDQQLGLVLGPRSVVNLCPGRRIAPDLFFLARERVPRPLPQQLNVIPELVLKIILPFNDPAEKRKIYKEAAVNEIWWVDPLGERIIVDRRGPKRYGTGIFTQGYVESRVLVGFRLDTAWLWSDPLPNVMQCLRDLLR